MTTLDKKCGEIKTLLKQLLRLNPAQEYGTETNVLRHNMLGNKRTLSVLRRALLCISLRMMFRQKNRRDDATLTILRADSL